MEIAGYEVTVYGNLPDRDTVLIEDAVMFLNDKLSQTILREIHVVEEGYDLRIRFRSEETLVRLRRDARDDWHIELPSAVDAVVQRLPV